jgi:hypothetical protein
MNLNFLSNLRSRTTAVVAGATLLTLAVGGGAFASGQVTSDDIKDKTIQAVDLATASVDSRVLGDESVNTAAIQDGAVHGSDLNEGLAAKIDKGAAPRYVGPDWSIVDRNVMGNGDSYLRTGPTAGTAVKPPLGIGSLGMRTGSPDDKAAFGDQVDFAGTPLSAIDTVSYYVFTTGENNSAAANNLPSVEFEVNPHTARTFSTLVYVPTSADSNAWTKLDASTAQQWYFTGGEGTDTGCNQVTYCTLAQAKAAAPDATLFSTQFNKGRDYAFSGAVDALQINGTVYDFEPNGVSASPAN